MNRNLVRSVGLALTMLLMLIVLTSCGNGGDGSGEADLGFVYVPEYFSLPDDVDGMNNLCFFDGLLYFSSYGVVGTDEPADALKPGDADYYEGMYDKYGAKLCKINVDGTGYEQLSAYQLPILPEGKEGDVSLSAMVVDNEGNIWAAENGYLYHTDESGNWVDDGSMNYLRKLDATGAELESVDITSLTDSVENFNVGSIRVDKDGNIYITDGNMSVYALDKDGQLLCTLEVQDWIQGLVGLADGRVGVLSYEGSGEAVKIIDIAAKAWGESIELPYNVYEVYNGGGDYDFYYKDNSNFYGYDIASATGTKLINWINSDIDSSNMQSIISLADGRIVCSMNTYSQDGDSSQEMAILTKTDSSKIEDKTILNMATMYLSSEIRTAIIDFNKTNPKYRIAVTDYSEFNTEDDYEAGLLKLNTEIISGKVPDIMDVSQLPIHQYVSKGLLEDLYPYIDNDSEISRDDLMSSVLGAMEIEGGLYQVSPNFSIITVIGASSVVGPEMGWTIDDLNALLASKPEGTKAFANVTRDSILYYSCILGMADYVDWQTGDCNFDSDGFIKMLEFANTFPAEIDWENYEEMESEDSLIQSGKVLLSTMSIGDFEEYQMYQAMYGGDVTFKGYPAESGIGSVVSIDSGLAMSSKCADKDGAWEFMRVLLSEKYQTDNCWWGLPTNKTCFDAKVAKAMEKETYTDENGVEVEVSRGSWGFGDTEVEIMALTQADADKIIELINAVDSTVSFDNSMMEIINEEAAAYFAGQKTAADTAAIIQSRIKIYVNEQK